MRYLPCAAVVAAGLFAEAAEGAVGAADAGGGADAVVAALAAADGAGAAGVEAADVVVPEGTVVVGAVEPFAVGTAIGGIWLARAAASICA